MAEAGHRTVSRALRALVSCGVRRGRAVMRSAGSWPTDVHEAIRDAFIELAHGQRGVTCAALSAALGRTTGRSLMPAGSELPARMPLLRVLFTEACAETRAPRALKLRDFEILLGATADRFLARRESSAASAVSAATRRTAKTFRGDQLAFRHGVFALPASARSTRRARVPMAKVQAAFGDAGLPTSAGGISSMLSALGTPTDGTETDLPYAAVERLMLCALPAESVHELLVARGALVPTPRKRAAESQEEAAQHVIST